jgi:NADP-dependent aldehyde dehydrogenase
MEKTIDDGGIYSAPAVIKTTVGQVSMHPETLAIECFGPTGLIVTYSSIAELLSLIERLEGALTGSVFASVDDESAVDLCRAVAQKVGRLSWNAWPTGVAVSVGQQHGGPYPASTSSIHTSVGLHAISRFLRPVSYQNFPKEITDQIL